MTITISADPERGLRRQAADPLALEGNNAAQLLPAWRRQDPRPGSPRARSRNIPSTRQLDRPYQLRRARRRDTQRPACTASRSTCTPVGFCYRKDIFKKVGITVAPTTLAELESDDAKLRAIGVAPIAVGSQGPLAGRVLVLLLRAARLPPGRPFNRPSRASSSPPVLRPKASNDLAAFLKINPFQTGFLAPPPSGRGQLGRPGRHRKAAMELMGDWDPGVMEASHPEQEAAARPRLVPLPGGSRRRGRPDRDHRRHRRLLVSPNAPKEAFEFLEYLVTTPEQRPTPRRSSPSPVNKAAQSVVTDSVSVSALQALNKAGLHDAVPRHAVRPRTSATR